LPGNHATKTCDQKKESGPKDATSDSAKVPIVKVRDFRGRLLPISYKPTEFDVICGKGNFSLGHVGNLRFKGIIKSKLPEYLKAKNRAEKAILITHVRELMRKDGLFVRQDKKCGRWYEVVESFVHEKVGQTFRDALSNVTTTLESAKEKGSKNVANKMS